MNDKVNELLNGELEIKHVVETPQMLGQLI